VIKTSCRTCHVAFLDDATAGGNNWTSYDQLKNRHALLKSWVLCDQILMPHSVITYRNFWLSGSPNQPGTLRDYSDGANWAALGACP